MRVGLFTRPSCIALYLVTLVYGVLFSVYVTFAVDLFLSVGALTPPIVKLFWMLKGLAGIPAIFPGELVACFGSRLLLRVSIPLCGFAYALIAMLPQNVPAIDFPVGGASPTCRKIGRYLFGLCAERAQSGVVSVVHGILAGSTRERRCARPRHSR